MSFRQNTLESGASNHFPVIADSPVLPMRTLELLYFSRRFQS